jgi:hypothetical protein
MGAAVMTAFTKSPFAAVAPLLHEYGYSPVPIKPGEKAPMLDDWQVPQDPKHYLPACAWWGTGILTATCPAIDLDIRDKEVVRVLIELADEMLGIAPFRIGQPPKALLLYGTAVPFAKITGRWWALPSEDFSAEGYNGHRIEILGHGNQFVAFAKHPRGTYYRWRRYSPISLHRDVLVPIDEAETRAFLDKAEKIIQCAGAVQIERRNGKCHRVEQKQSSRRRESSGERIESNWQQLDPETLAKKIDSRARQSATGWKLRCPAHDDRSPSFTVSRGDGGRPIVHCFGGCTFPEIARAIENIVGKAA